MPSPHDRCPANRSRCHEGPTGPRGLTPQPQAKANATRRPYGGVAPSRCSPCVTRLRSAEQSWVERLLHTTNNDIEHDGGGGSMMHIDLAGDPTT